MATDILQRIIAQKKQEVARGKKEGRLPALRAAAETAHPVRGFYDALFSRVVRKEPAVIAEIKKASPSKGVIREDFEPSAIARSYTAAGAACLSVLTDTHFFQGRPEYLQQARGASSLPIIRKDFVIDAYQVYETRAMGADAMLLIVSALDSGLCTELSQLARELDLEVLVEVHSAPEMEFAMSLGTHLIGINNRDLRTFETRLEVSASLAAGISDADLVLVAESGIHCREDVEFLQQSGIWAFLIGEACMKAEDPGRKLREIFLAAA